MKDKKILSTFWKKAIHKYRFVIMTDDSFEERFSIKLNRLNALVIFGVFFVICVASSLIIITNSSLSEYLPGRAKTDVQKEIISLSTVSDSLINRLEKQSVYLENIRNIIAGDGLVSPKIGSINNINVENLSFEKTIADSVLRAVVESEEVGVILNNVKKNSELQMFFSPLKGVITDRFSSASGHFGLDIVAKEKTRVSSVLDGVVIISHWTPNTGYVVGIQHKNGYVSMYKHNSVLLKEVGDFVFSGEHVAIIGNSGEFSYGAHLHFELWHEGVPVNPENYILF